MTHNFTKIIYVFDPLCGWCYGMEPVIEKIQVQYKDYFEFEILPGGMVLEPNAQPIGKMKDYLLEAIPRLEETTGVSISKNYMDNILGPGTAVLNSEMPSMVFSALHKSYTGKEAQLARKIQDILYQEGKNTNDLRVYENLIKDSIDKELDEVSACILSDENRAQTFGFFKKSKDLGVTGFPFLGLEDDQGQVYKVAAGYVPFKQLAEFMEKVTA